MQLESFLLAHIYYHSQVEDFTTNDLIAIAKESAMLIVFDGFDEIADMKLRTEVIEIINKGINRLSESAISLQVLITSRPAAFTDSVGFEVNEYPHMELTDINPGTIAEYLNKWVESSELTVKDGQDLIRQVQSKLQMPHLKDLTRSPMQLAILISLLNTKGDSLPNKRTALYDSYITLFFDRESEKSKLILDNRELIINIHQYLAWVLHSEAEMFKNSGRISHEDLIDKLRKYLVSDGRKPDFADQLFNAMSERVCALVSRIQGTFEFEVQPLREYFCAKYLYDTAPHSSPGNENPGSKPDRLHAILRNNYWQNVVRFFAGCMGKGELNLLIDELSELHQDINLKLTSYPRVITTQILSDYVLTQSPKKVTEAVELILRDIRNKTIYNQTNYRSSFQRISLPDECGLEELNKACFAILKTYPYENYAEQLRGIIRLNYFANGGQFLEFLGTLSGQPLTRWLDYGIELSTLDFVNASLIEDILNKSNSRELRDRLLILLRGNRTDVILSNVKFKEEAIKVALSGEISITGARNMTSFEFLNMILNPYVFQHIMVEAHGELSILNALAQYHGGAPGDSPDDLINFAVYDSADVNINDLKNALLPLLNMDVNTFASNPSVIESWIEILRSHLGDNQAIFNIATVTSPVKVDITPTINETHLFDETVSLIQRLRFVQTRAQDISYWRKLLSNTFSNINQCIQLIFLWAPPTTIVALSEELISLLSTMSTEEFLDLGDQIDRTTQDERVRKGISSYPFEIAKKRNRLNYLISMTNTNYPNETINYLLPDPDEDLLENVYGQQMDYLLYLFYSNEVTEDSLLKIKTLFGKMKMIKNTNTYYYSEDKSKLSHELAKKILENSSDYPTQVLAEAEAICQFHASSIQEQIGAIAEREHWFSET